MPSEELQQNEVNQTTEVEEVDAVRDPQAVLKAYESTKEQLKAYKERGRSLEENYNKLKSQVEQFDPKEYEELKEKVSLYEEEKMKREKRYEDLLARRDSELDSYRKQVEEAKQQHTQLLVRTQLEKAFYEAGGRKGHFEALEPQLSKWASLSDEGRLQFLDTDNLPVRNTDGKEKSASEAIAERFANHDIWAAHFEPSHSASGSGMPAQNGRRRLTMDELGKLPPAERITKAREMGLR